jgi:hypothetical protein
MTIPNQPEREPDDTPVFDMEAPDTGHVDSVDDPERLTGGAWLSLALSVSFYLVMLAIGANTTAITTFARKRPQQTIRHSRVR